MSLLVRTLAMPARHGRTILVLGLVVGIAFPGPALALKDWIDEMVAGLLFVAALRVGPRQAFGALSELRASLGFALLYQVALPLAAMLAFALAGWTGALATGLVLMTAAPPLSGSPNLALLTGNDPAPALRQVVVGTALLPLTALPVFWLAPALGDATEVIGSAARLLLVIGGVATAAFLIRGFLVRDPSPEALRFIDGLSALVLAVVVVGLMSAVGPAIRSRPEAVLATIAAVFAGNFGLQIATALILRRFAPGHTIAPLSIAAGNRNIALFLTALPAAVTEPLLLFIGCYQIPMYLTPILLSRLYRRCEPRRLS